MRDIRIKLISILCIVSIFFVLIMWIFHGFFVVRNIQYFSESYTSFIPIVFITLLIGSLILYKISTPLHNYLQNELNPLEAVKSINTIPKIFIAVQVLGFFIGPIIKNLPLIIQGESLALSLISLSNSFTIGLISAYQSIYLANIILIKPQKLLKHFHIDDKIFSLRKRHMLLSVIESMFIVSYVASYGYGISNSSTITAQNFLQESIFIYGLAILIPLLLHFTVQTEQKNNMKNLIKVISNLNNGNANLKDRISIIRNDDIGLLTSKFNQFLDKQDTFLQEIYSLSSELNNSSTNLNNSSDEVLKATQEIIQSIDSLKDNNSQQNKTLNITKEKFQNLSDTILEVHKNVETQAIFVNESSSAITEMVTNIGAVEENTENSQKISDKLYETSKLGGNYLKKTISSIQEIDKFSKEIIEISGIISDFADQTNLLAMNASIEASHAGDAGGGFSVVAGEIRALAEKSSNNANNISNLINEMINSISDTVSLAEKAGQAFNDIISNINKNNELTNVIATAMEEQNYGAQEIMKSTEELVKSSENIKSIADNQKKQNKVAQDNYNYLINLSSKIDNEVETQSKDSNVLDNIVKELNNIANSNNEISSKLFKLVKSFGE